MSAHTMSTHTAKSPTSTQEGPFTPFNMFANMAWGSAGGEDELDPSGFLALAREQRLRENEGGPRRRTNRRGSQDQDTADDTDDTADNNTADDTDDTAEFTTTDASATDAIATDATATDATATTDTDPSRDATDMNTTSEVANLDDVHDAAEGPDAVRAVLPSSSAPPHDIKDTAVAPDQAAAAAAATAEGTTNADAPATTAATEETETAGTAVSTVASFSFATAAQWLLVALLAAAVLYLLWWLVRGAMGALRSLSSPAASAAAAPPPASSATHVHGQGPPSLLLHENVEYATSATTTATAPRATPADPLSDQMQHSLYRLLHQFK
jgi:hypothetical protein